ncbi:MAG: TonB-dependent receptor [Acidobacteria bacterium]|nr:TonB-dependent receptor [Acidobacteriota bacterium]
MVLSHLVWGQEGVSLAELPLEKLLQLVVTAPSKTQQSPSDAPAVISVLTQADIERWGATNLYELLQQVTSVYMLGSHFYPQNIMAMRGDVRTHADNHVLILINGVPFRESATGGQNFSVYLGFPLTALERVEVIRGPGSVLHGSNAISAVINLVTRKEVEPTVRVRGGQLATQELDLFRSWQLGAWQMDVAARFHREMGWDFSPRDQTGTQDSISYGESTQSAMVQFHKQEEQLSLLFLDSSQDFWGAIAQWAGPIPAQDRSIRSKRWFIAWDQETPFLQGWVLDRHLSIQGSEFEHYNYNLSANDYFGEINLHTPPHTRWRSVIGATAWVQNVDSQSGLQPAPIQPNRNSRFSAFAETMLQIQPNMSLSGGLQLNKTESFQTNWLPRLAFNWHPKSSDTLKLLYNQAYRTPFAIETHFNIIIRDGSGNISGGLRGNPRLEPETAKTWEAQWIRQSKRMNWSLACFMSEQSDLISRERAPDQVLEYVNAGKWSSRGLEAEGLLQISPDFKAQIGASYQENHNESGLDNPSLVPHSLIKLGLFYSKESWQLGLFDFYASRPHDVAILAPSRLEVNPPAEAVHRVSLKLGYTFLGSERSEILMALRVSNALDESIQEPEFVGRRINTIPAEPGRNFSLQFTLR